MNDVIARAAALKGLIEATSGASEQPLAEAALGCCEELLRMGETAAALSLIRDSERLTSGAGPEWALRHGIVRVHALSQAGEFDHALMLVRGLKADCARLLSSSCNEAYQLRIREANILWLTNRADESVELLTEIRTELLSRPDSVLLASCASSSVLMLRMPSAMNALC